MSSPHAFAFDAVAVQLVAALDAYDRETEAVIAAWPDLERYREFSAQLEKIRGYSSGLHDLRVQWVELLIAHAELVHFLWRIEYGDAESARAEVVAVREHHADCVMALRNRCLRIQMRVKLRRPAPAGNTSVPR
ncbi:MAG TPA: hypothetical protein VNB23_16410 [Ramlibacter sp.]|nr:hypothetical protein [Ramlibacter sp.]